MSTFLLDIVWLKTSALPNNNLRDCVILAKAALPAEEATMKKAMNPP